MAHSLRILKMADWFKVRRGVMGKWFRERESESDNNLDTFNFIANLIKLLTATIHVYRTCEIYCCSKLG